MHTPAPLDQNTLWNGPGGQTWVAQQALLDGLFQPLADALRSELPATVTELLDIGCGTGASVLAAAQARPGARCTGVDISAPMLALARQRAAGLGLDIDFIVADAQRHRFDSARYDWVQSRLGVMFFDDTQAAFANLHRAARSGAGLRAIAWRGAEENPFMTTAERTVGDQLALPERRPGAPGQFAFADAGQVRRQLQDAGWRDVQVQPLDLACSLARDDLPAYVRQLGPIGLALRSLPADRADALHAQALAAFAPFIEGDRVRVDAACWLLRACA
ncbi:class I SAM-dependent methyltransferase [Stenotrophomonas maltophilia]|uniref:class I SAM-dependent methyltransferase n=1 Tax=Stenotrophomonas maltophilia TaxID=40324 RepID=UPI0034DADB59